jgi:hypothetical protein
MRGQNVDRDRAIEARVTRAIHLAHPPGTHGGEDFIGAEADARCEGHGIV